MSLVPSSFGRVRQPTLRHAPAALFLDIAKEGMGMVASRCSEDKKIHHQKQPEKQHFI